MNFSTRHDEASCISSFGSSQCLSRCMIFSSKVMSPQKVLRFFHPKVILRLKSECLPPHWSHVPTHKCRSPMVVYPVEVLRNKRCLPLKICLRVRISFQMTAMSGRYRNGPVSFGHFHPFSFYAPRSARVEPRFHLGSFQGNMRLQGRNVSC